MDLASINLNRIPYAQVSPMIRQLLDEIADRERMADSFYKSLDQFDAALAAVGSHADGAKLIRLDEIFWQNMELFLEPIDTIMHLHVDDFYHRFEEADLTIDEALQLIPRYRAAFHLMPRSSEYRHGYCNPTSGDLYGFVWDEEYISLLIPVLKSPESLEHSNFLSLTKIVADLVESYETVMEFTAKIGATEELLLLRNKKRLMASVLNIAMNTRFPDSPYERTPWELDPRSITYPILEQRRLQKMMEEFSYNDLSHESFVTIASTLRKKYQKADEASLNLPYEKFEEKYDSYISALEPFRNSPYWEEFMEWESIWYRDVERIILAIECSLGSLYCEDPVKWKEHEEGSRFQSAMTLWDLIPHNPFDSWMSISRGYQVGDDQWITMKTTYPEVEYQIMLEEIGASDLFSSCVEADNNSVRIAELIHSEGENGLGTLRHKRAHLVATFNVMEL